MLSKYESIKSKHQKNNNEFTPSSKNNDETQFTIDEISPIKPIAINPKKLSKINNETPTLYSSPMDLTNINLDSEIPVIYPQFQLRCIRDFKNSNTMDFSNFVENNENLDKKDNFVNYNISENKEHNSKLYFCCSCTKTKCIKKYCECFANKRLCKDCRCQNCMNNIYHLNNKIMQKNYTRTKNIICTCSKSNCNKKYCECYKAGVFCNEKCRCVNCKNNQKSNLNKNENIDLDEEKFLSRNNSLSSNNSNSEESYKVEKISVFINNNQTYINREKYGIENFKLLGKKTNKHKNNKN